MTDYIKEAKKLKNQFDYPEKQTFEIDGFTIRARNRKHALSLLKHLR